MIYGVINAKGEDHYTYLQKIFNSIGNIQKDYNWLITNCECYPKNPETEKLLNSEYCWLTGEQLTEMILEEDFQWIWGILSGFNKNIEPSEVLKYGLPCEDDYNKYFIKPLALQHPLAHIEIVPFDSTFTLFLSKDKEIADSFIQAFPYSQNLDDYIID